MKTLYATFNWNKCPALSTSGGTIPLQAAIGSRPNFRLKEDQVVFTPSPHPIRTLSTLSGMNAGIALIEFGPFRARSEALLVWP